MEYLTRSKAAFRMSCDHFIEQAEAKGQRVFFWTFTFRKVLDTKTAFAMWVRFARRLHQWGKNKDTGENTIVGLRVAEMHPGGHGVHFHALINRYVNVNIVRRIASKYGFGRINVRRVRKGSGKIGSLARYMTKYLSKQDRPPCLKGKRMWQAFGEWSQTKCKDVVIDTEFCAAFKARRKFVEAERVLAQETGQAYRVEGALETMEHARRHVHKVSLGLAEPLRPDLWYSPPEMEVEKVNDFDDWEGVFSGLTVPSPLAVANGFPA